MFNARLPTTCGLFCIFFFLNHYDKVINTMTTLVKEYGSLREKIAAEKQDRLDNYARFEAVWNMAISIGHLAAVAERPTPMGICDSSGELIDIISEGPCGFSEIRIKGNTQFGRWAKKNAGFKNCYSGGLSFWVSAYNQSMERKQAFSHAVVTVLNEKLNVDAWSSSRMD